MVIVAELGRYYEVISLFSFSIVITFISLAEALQDPAYQSPDSYTGPGGITWLHRWAITRNVDPAMFRGVPETPEYILKLTELREHNYATDQ